MSKRFLDCAQVVTGVAPLDLDTDRASDYVSMQNYDKLVCIFTKSPGTAGDDFNLSFQQATSAAGAGAKDLTVGIDTYWIKQAATDLTAVGTFTKTTQTAATTVLGNATSAEQAVMLVVEIDGNQLDTANGFYFVKCDVTLDASGGAQYGALVWVLLDPKSAQEPSISAIA